MTASDPATTATWKARLAGVLYVVVFASAYAEIARSGLIVSGDAGATSASILASEGLFRLTIAADAVAIAAYVGVAVLLYGLLRPAGRTLSLMAAAYGLVGGVMMAANLLNQLEALVLLTGGDYLGAVPRPQLQAEVLSALRLHTFGYTLTGIFFGLHLLFWGVLIARSMFLPRLLGWLLVVGGTCYVLNAFCVLLAPSLAGSLYPFSMAPGAISEIALTLWLLARGLNGSRWVDQATAPSTFQGGEGHL